MQTLVELIPPTAVDQLLRYYQVSDDQPPWLTFVNLINTRRVPRVPPTIANWVSAYRSLSLNVLDTTPAVLDYEQRMVQNLTINVDNLSRWAKFMSSTQLLYLMQFDHAINTGYYNDHEFWSSLVNAPFEFEANAQELQNIYYRQREARPTRQVIIVSNLSRYRLIPDNIISGSFNRLAVLNDVVIVRGYHGFAAFVTSKGLVYVLEALAQPLINSGGKLNRLRPILVPNNQVVSDVAITWTPNNGPSLFMITNNGEVIRLLSGVFETVDRNVRQLARVPESVAQETMVRLGRDGRLTVVTSTRTVTIENYVTVDRLVNDNGYLFITNNGELHGIYQLGNIYATRMIFSTYPVREALYTADGTIVVLSPTGRLTYRKLGTTEWLSPDLIYRHITLSSSPYFMFYGIDLEYGLNGFLPNGNRRIVSVAITDDNVQRNFNCGEVCSFDDETHIYLVDDAKLDRFPCLPHKLPAVITNYEFVPDDSTPCADENGEILDAITFNPIPPDRLISEKSGDNWHCFDIDSITQLTDRAINPFTQAPWSISTLTKINRYIEHINNGHINDIIVFSNTQHAAVHYPELMTKSISEVIEKIITQRISASWSSYDILTLDGQSLYDRDQALIIGALNIPQPITLFVVRVINDPRIARYWASSTVSSDN